MRRAANLAALLAAVLGAPAHADSYLARAEVAAFVGDLVDRHRFDAAELRDLFRDVTTQQRVLEAIARPAERKPWREYRPIFLTESRIAEGVTFWGEHAALLDSIAADTGVPAEILVAIVGVETRYGRYRGRYPALDTLATLAFDYPPRARFFRRELEQFLLLARDEGLDARRVKGSYAAAMGMPQFISSSYREYAVDYDKDGRRDLWDSTADVLGSVANYFLRHGWRAGEPVSVPVPAPGEAHKPLLRKSLKPALSREQVAPLLPEGLPAEAGEGPFSVIELAGREGVEVWLGYYNFYVITRYNHSPLYAMAVYQLSEAIRERRQGGGG